MWYYIFDMAIIKNKKLDKAVEREVCIELLKEFKKVDSFCNLDYFLNKFMTPSERIILTRRIAVMKLLEQKRKYRDIKELLGISSGTISKINDIITGRGYGKNPNRKRKYSNSTIFKKIIKKRGLRYKGTSGLLDPFA